MSFYYHAINNWQLYAFIIGMMAFVLILIVSMLVCIVKQDNPDIELPRPIKWFID